jgi:hypothetical protein
MSGVVLRCRHCGTTQGTRGECQACHEAHVEFYCTRHAPGLWLDAPKCSQCGAEFGKAAPPPTGGRAPAPARRRDPPPRPRPPAEMPSPKVDPWGRADAPEPPSTPPPASRAILERLLREHYRRRAERAPEERYVIRESFGPALAGGCLRILLFMFLLMLVLTYFLSSLGGMFYVF